MLSEIQHQEILSDEGEGNQAIETRSCKSRKASHTQLRQPGCSTFCREKAVCHATAGEIKTHWSHILISSVKNKHS